MTFNFRRAMVMTHTHAKVKVIGYSVQKVRVETIEAIAIPPVLTWSIIIRK